VRSLKTEGIIINGWVLEQVFAEDPASRNLDNATRKPTLREEDVDFRYGSCWNPQCTLSSRHRRSHVSRAAVKSGLCNPRNRRHGESQGEHWFRMLTERCEVVIATPGVMASDQEVTWDDKSLHNTHAVTVIMGTPPSTHPISS
jgi:hypothetical protein